MDKELRKKLEDFGCEIYKTGSREICVPAPTDTDDDYLVYIEGKKTEAKLWGLLEEKEGFELDENEHYPSTDNLFNSFKKGKLNLIVTRHESFCEKHVLATQVCKKLNLLKKEDRIMIFQAVLYGKFMPKEEVF